MDSRLREELSQLSIEEMIEMLENSNMDIIPGLWKGILPRYSLLEID
jgi:hypothetical protein